MINVVAAAIGENGGFSFRRHDVGHGVERHFWHDEADRVAVSQDLAWVDYVWNASTFSKNHSRVIDGDIAVALLGTSLIGRV